MRIDKPTLMCDRCRVQTEDLTEMGRYSKVVHEHMSGRRLWDLCPPCFTDFREFMNWVGDVS